MTDAEVLAQIDAAFGAADRPRHFTDYRHCCECADHDELLRSRTRETLRLADVGNPGWDAICFITPQGFAYYMPTLARLALAPPDREFGWYADQLLFHLHYGESDNRHRLYCNEAQRAAVAAMLRHIMDTRSDVMDEQCVSNDEFQSCYELWK